VPRLGIGLEEGLGDLRHGAAQIACRLGAFTCLAGGGVGGVGDGPRATV
jgi:hypothetical protein